MRPLLWINLLCCLITNFSEAQTQLPIPAALSGTSFSLQLDDSITQFWPGINTTTYGINGNILGPTLFVNQGDLVTMHVTNNLPGTGNSTTMHWHGLHVPAMADGGPHQVIAQGSTWSPSFTIMNRAGTYWYHPHGLNKTDRHVSKGLAGMIVVKDATESALNLPRTYGIDDIPLIIQTKEFDVLHQIAIATFMDTTVMVNGVIEPYVNIPAQVVRLRLLNGSSSRTFEIGFSNNMYFSLIATDGGLIDTPRSVNRLRLSNGERAEILVNVSGMQNDTISLLSYGSELPHGIYGADSVGDLINQIPDYYNNGLNGTDFSLLQMRVVAQTVNPIVTIPNTLVPLTMLQTDANTVYRSFDLDTLTDMGITPNPAAGPFAFNRKLFNMDSINEVVYLNSKEVWALHNKTMVAHPFHIHDIQLQILDINGAAPSPTQRGWKDVVLVMPGDSVRFITQFTDFADDSIPYMYHCHVLHHEDDGMMGSFLVIDTSLSAGNNEIMKNTSWMIYPNPSSNQWQFESATNITSYTLYDIQGRAIEDYTAPSGMKKVSIDNQKLPSGVYILKAQLYTKTIFTKISKW